jgi:hypothetical protein
MFWSLLHANYQSATAMALSGTLPRAVRRGSIGRTANDPTNVAFICSILSPATLVVKILVVKILGRHYPGAGNGNQLHAR